MSLFIEDLKSLFRRRHSRNFKDTVCIQFGVLDSLNPKLTKNDWILMSTWVFQRSKSIFNFMLCCDIYWKSKKNVQKDVLKSGVWPLARATLYTRKYGIYKSYFSLLYQIQGKRIETYSVSSLSSSLPISLSLSVSFTLCHCLSISVCLSDK